MSAFFAAFAAALAVSDPGGGDPGSPPEGMAWVFATNGDPVTDKNNQPIYAKEPA